MNIFIKRSQKLADTYSQKQKENILKSTLLQNRFSENTIKRAHRSTKFKAAKEEQNVIAKVYLPQIKQTTDKMEKALKKHKIDTTFLAHNKINSFPGAKTKISLKNRRLYHIPVETVDILIIQQEAQCKKRETLN